MLSPNPIPPGFTPQSDGRRLIFPLSLFRGTFKTDHFLPSLVDHRCSLDDINYFLNDIYYHTKRMSAIRVSTRLAIWSLVLFIMSFICGISIELENDMNEFNEYDDSGFMVIIIGIFCLIIINIFAAVYRSNGKGKLFRQIVSVLERHKHPFLQKGLRWAIPENCLWLELWMDYQFFSPYYMQQYIPSNLGCRCAVLAPQFVPKMSQQPEICENQLILNKKMDIVQASQASEQEIPLETGYPHFENRPFIPYNNVNLISNPAANKTNINSIQMQTMGLYPQPSSLNYQYPFYQPPYLQETLANPIR